MDPSAILGEIWGFFSEEPVRNGLLTLVSGAFAGTGIFAWRRRIRSDEPGEAKIGPFFMATRLLTSPLKRPAYSDRMAYVLAEMSDLAYYEFEGRGGAVLDAVKLARDLDVADEQVLTRFLDTFSRNLMGSRSLSEDFLRDLLAAAGFELLETICVQSTQAFACKRSKDGEPPYVVIAFRGTEKQKVSDWLTDARAVPTQVDSAKVHSGFWKALTRDSGNDQKTVHDRIAAILESDAARDRDGNALPVFITGHSLGGALALLATRNLASNINGACYTFGAPRVASYEFFETLKTPVYRVVNSSDVVPRVPPGAAQTLLLRAVQGAAWLTSLAGPVSKGFEKLETWIDRLNGYRHFGDLRYLTDVAAGQWDTVRLLSNPPAIDRIIWMWRHLASSLFFPLSAHSMAIYRKKLETIANSRV
jgi:hypothetical protein